VLDVDDPGSYFHNLLTQGNILEAERLSYLVDLMPSVVLCVSSAITSYITSKARAAIAIPYTHHSSTPFLTYQFIVHIFSLFLGIYVNCHGRIEKLNDTKMYSQSQLQAS
jgi:hypothetical protein